MKSTNVLSACLVMSMIACSQQRQASENSGASSATGAAKSGELSGTIRIDGSSTVYPITEAVAKSFKSSTTRWRDGRRIRHRRWDEESCTGHFEITGASRPIKGKEIKNARNRALSLLRYRLPTTASLWCFTKRTTGHRTSPSLT